MAFADDLLELSYDLVNLEKENPRQASLRRAISTAYYALFHLLIHEAALNWRHVEQRPALSRSFDHGKMKSASKEKLSKLNREIDKQTSARETAVLMHLKTVANTFVEAQRNRLEADYNNAQDWTRTDVLAELVELSQAFTSWNAIREESVAQEYLLSLLLGKERRSE